MELEDRLRDERDPALDRNELDPPLWALVREIYGDMSKEAPMPCNDQPSQPILWSRCAGCMERIEWVKMEDGRWQAVDVALGQVHRTTCVALAVGPRPKVTLPRTSRTHF